MQWVYNKNTADVEQSNARVKFTAKLFTYMKQGHSEFSLFHNEICLSYSQDAKTFPKHTKEYVPS